MLSFEHVSKFILSDINLHIPQGVCVGIIGESGAGKTTLLKLACGLLCAERGNVYTFQKNPVDNRKAVKPHIGCLLEGMPVLNAEQSVWENLQGLQIIYRLSDEEFAKEYEPLAEWFGVKELEQLPVKSLSFGQRRRAELVAVFLHHPKLILLDEPTNGLDENAKQQLRELLKQRVSEGMTAVISSHDMREVSETCQRLVVLEQGKLVYYGEEETLLRQYVPMDIMRIKSGGKLPDMEDLPIAKYKVQGDEFVLTYNSNYITASEILEVIVKQISVQEVSVQKPGLAEVIFEIKRNMSKEAVAGEQEEKV